MKKRIITAFLALTLCFALFQYVAAQAPQRGVARFEIIIEPQYEDAGMFFEGLAAVKMDGKWGYIDTENKVVIPFEYDYAGFFSEGYAVVGKNGTYSFEWNQWDWDSEEHATVTDEYDVIYLGRIDTQGSFRAFEHLYFNWETEQILTQELHFETEWFEYSRQYYYYGGWANINNYVFDTNASQFRTEDDRRFSARYVPTEGLVSGLDSWDEAGVVFFRTDGSIALDLRGETFLDENMIIVQVPDIYSDEYLDFDWDNIKYSRFISEALPFNQGLSLVWETLIDLDSWQMSERFGFIDRRGDWVIEPQFNFSWGSSLAGESRFFTEGGLACVGKDGVMGAINTAGNTEIAFQYSDLRLFSEGLAPFMRGRLAGYADIEGNEVIAPKFEETSGFRNAVALAYDGARTFLIDRKGNEIQGSGGVNYANYIFANADGTMTVFTPGEIITIAEDGRFGFGRIEYLPPLPDLHEMDYWAVQEVILAIEENLVPVSMQNMFRIDATRDDFCRLIMHALSTVLDMDKDEIVLKHTGKSIDAWARDNRFIDTVSRDIIAAAALDIVRGYDEGGGVFTFRPHNTITRQEAAVLLWRTAGVLDLDTGTDPPEAAFSDQNKIESWAIREVDYINFIDVMRGVSGNAFDPAGTYTRQQSFMTIYRLFFPKDD